MAEMRPALTPEEWRVLLYAFDQDDLDEGARNTTAKIHTQLRYLQESLRGGEDFAHPNRRHPLAAIALLGQPFGFRWEDVHALNSIAHTLECLGGTQPAQEIRDVTDRIAALLPPRENGEPSPPENP